MDFEVPPNQNSDLNEPADLAHLNSLLRAAGSASLAVLPSDQQTIKTLLQDRRLHMQARIEQQAANKRLESEKHTLYLEIEKGSRQKQAVQKERDALSFRFGKLEKNLKEELTKVIRERDELLKTVRSIATKESQYNHQLKKKQNSAIQLKQMVHKKLQIAFESEPLARSQEKSSCLATDQVKTTIHSLSSENQYLRNALSRLSQTIYTSTGSPPPAPDSFQAPLPQLDELLKAVDERAAVGRRAAVVEESGAVLEGGECGDKSHRNVKGLIKNYRQVIESQDLMLQRIINNASKCQLGSEWVVKLSSQSEEAHFSEAKRMIDQQKKQVEQKGIEWHSMRQKVVSALEKLEVSRQCYRANEQAFGLSARHLRERLNAARDGCAD